MTMHRILILLLNLHSCFAGFLRPYPRPGKPQVHAFRAGKACSGSGKPGYIKSGLRRQSVSLRNRPIGIRDGREGLSEFQAGIVYMMDSEYATLAIASLG